MAATATSTLNRKRYGSPRVRPEDEAMVAALNRQQMAAVPRDDASDDDEDDEEESESYPSPSLVDPAVNEEVQALQAASQHVAEADQAAVAALYRQQLQAATQQDTARQRVMASEDFNSRLSLADGAAGRNTEREEPGRNADANDGESEDGTPAQAPNLTDPIGDPDMEGTEEEDGEELGDISEGAKANVLRQQRRAARSKQGAEDDEEGALGKAAGVALSPLNRETSLLLQRWWFLVPETFGLSILLIDLHVFASMIFGEKVFCKLGDEWLVGAEEGMGTKEPEFLKMIASGTGLAEKIIVTVYTGLLLFVVIINLVYYAAIVYVLSHPVDAFTKAVGLVFEGLAK